MKRMRYKVNVANGGITVPAPALETIREILISERFILIQTLRQFQSHNFQHEKVLGGRSKPASLSSMAHHAKTMKNLYTFAFIVTSILLIFSSFNYIYNNE